MALMQEWHKQDWTFLGVLFMISLVNEASGQATWIPPSAWTPDMYPNPRVDINRCGRQGHTSNVCDPNGVISYSQANELDRVIEDLRTGTGACICGKKCGYSGDYQGYQAAVALVNSIYFKSSSNPSSSQKRKAAEDFADELRDDDWEFGECNDDLVIFVSKQDRQVFTATGDETRVILTDNCVNKIFQKQKHYFSQGNFFEGLKETLKEYKLVLQRKHECNKPASATTYIILGVVIGGGVLGCVLFSILRQRYGICQEACTSDSTTKNGYESYSGHSTSHNHSSSKRDSVSSNSSGGGGGEF